MSVKMMTLVWESDLPPEQKYVLLKLADHANDEGGDVYPSIARVARLTGLSERTVQRRIQEMRVSGVLELVAGARDHRPNEYAIRGDSLTPLPKVGVTVETERGDTGGASGVTVVSPETSVNHQEPSEPRARNMRGYSRSDDSDKERLPGAKVERWLVAEMSKHFGVKIVQKHLQRCESFFVWRKIKQYVDDGERGTLKDLMPRAQAEYETELDQIQPEPESTDPEFDDKMREIYRNIKVTQESAFEAEYRAWEKANYPEVANA